MNGSDANDPSKSHNNDDNIANVVRPDYIYTIQNTLFKQS